jgi:ferric-dicitrate binding protein FerR (iron transport regulator)
MQNTGEDIQKLLIEKLVGTINPADDAWLTELIEKDETVRQQWTHLQSQLTEARQHGFTIEADEDAAWAQLQPGLKPHHNSRIFSLARIATAAAACLLLTTGVFYFYNRSKPTETHDTAKTAAGKQPEGITLRLANGQIIDLSTAGNKTIHTGNTDIHSADSALSYTAVPTPVQEWNTLFIPSTRNYTLTLADGTVVIMNSQTQIRFPFSFPGKTREVYIDGEAFFNVSKDATKPFIVHTPKTEIRVLGTRFNVNTYDSGKISTALVEGSVKINTTGHDMVTLTPGHEAIFNYDKTEFAVASFDAGETLSWIQGTYYFHNVSLQQLSKVLERWFAIQVQFKNNTLYARTFSGVLFKKESLQTFLDNLRASDAVNAELKDQVLYFW